MLQSKDIEWQTGLKKAIACNIPVYKRLTLAFLKKEEKSQINNLTYHLKELGKKNKQNLKSAERRKS